MLAEYLDILSMMFGSIVAILLYILLAVVSFVSFMAWGMLLTSVFSVMILGENTSREWVDILIGTIFGPLLTLFGVIPLFIMILN